MSSQPILTSTDPSVDTRFPRVTGETLDGSTKHALHVAPLDSSGELANALSSIAWDDTSTANTVYVGFSLPGTATSAASWRIMRVNTSTKRVMWADGDELPNNIWDNRTGLTYT